jgi:transposase
VTRFEQTKSLTTIRADDPQGYGALPVNLSRWSLKKVDEAFQAFFRRLTAKRGKGGFPRFKSRHRWRSFGFSEFSGIRLIDGALVFKGMRGRLELHLHRPLPENASIRSCTLTKEGRAWRVALQIELAEVHTVRREAGNLVGIDWGVERLATLSTGEAIENPRFGAAAAAGIRTAQRKLARAKRGSRRRLKAVAHLTRQRRKLANRRETHLHQLTAAIARRFGGIAVEELEVKNMTRGTPRRTARNAAARPQRTCRCVSLRCVHCQMEVHRDVNAARNVLKRAVAGPWSGFAQQNNGLALGRRSGNLEGEGRRLTNSGEDFKLRHYLSAQGFHPRWRKIAAPGLRRCNEQSKRRRL